MDLVFYHFSIYYYLSYVFKKCSVVVVLLIVMDKWFDGDYSLSSSSTGSFPDDLFECYSGRFGGVHELELDYFDLREGLTMDHQVNQPMHLINKDRVMDKPTPLSSSVQSQSICSVASFFPEPERSSKQTYQPTSVAHNDKCNNTFLKLGSDEDAITQAMVAVISTGCSPSSSSSSLTSPSQCDRRWGAFRPYNRFLTPIVESKSSCRQNIAKRAISLMRKIGKDNFDARESKTQLASNQTLHVISERKRREKLNGSFHALRQQLPTGSKKDKASVLINAKNYLNTLRDQIAELKEENQVLESRLNGTDVARSHINDSRKKVELQVVRALQQELGIQEICLVVKMMVQCDIQELAIQILECLKGMRVVKLVDMDVSMYIPWITIYASATLTLQLKGKDWNEDLFKQIITRAIDGIA